MPRAQPAAQEVEPGAPAGNGPLSPEEALASFQLEQGYRIELAAAEPLIRDPVAMAFDDRGRMFVVESRGYPGPLEGAPAPAALEGVIALVEDSNGDGRFDKRTDFARDLAFPNGVMPWDGGVLVTSAPDLLFFKDTNGDGVADVRRVLLTGFDATRTAQLRFSHPTWGLDNWVYLTGGLAGGRVTSPDHPERAPITFSTGDSRFNPQTGAFELTGGQSQYGLTFDDYGRRFTCSNRRPAMHAVLEPRYLQRNPHLTFSETVEDVAAPGAQAMVWPVSGDTTTASFMPSLLSTPHAGRFTAASGIHIHRGDALPAGHRGSMFVCESAQNLVQRQVMSQAGVTFTARPAQPGREFLASRDTWFRPVFAANGPDGALYIVDMYRRVIDHPQYVPEQSRVLLDFAAGKERGRIYRIVAGDRRTDRRAVYPGRMDTTGLVKSLEHPNAWWRETAQRLLIERRDRRVLPLLRRVAHTSRSEVGRLHALWSLEGLGALEGAHLIDALQDPHPAVRENAVHLAEARLRASEDLVSSVLRLAEDRDERVRFRVALALGETKDVRGLVSLAAMARRDGTQRWVRAAILSSIGDRSADFLAAFDATPSKPAVRAAVMHDLGQLFGAGESADRGLDFVMQSTAPGTDFGGQLAALSGLAAGLRGRSMEQPERSALMTLLARGSPRARAAMSRVESVLSRAAREVLDPEAPAEHRLAATRLLGYTDYATAGGTLRDLLAPQHGSEIQLAAVRALGQLPERAAAAMLVEAPRWQAYTPQVREAVLSLLLSDERLTPVLLDAVGQGVITGATLGPLRRARLTGHRNTTIQERARALLLTANPEDRMQVYERLRGPVLARAAEPARGRPVFAIHCAACHAVDGKGGQVGPDLSGLRNQPAEAILLHALVPDYEITPGYQAYTVQTRDGRTLFGRLESEAPNSVTLRDGASQQHAILRSDVVAMSASPRSLMPAELERGMSEQELADLLAYLKANPRPR